MLSWLHYNRYQTSNDRFFVELSKCGQKLNQTAFIKLSETLDRILEIETEECL